jgi:glycosyltransferase involved in cell wall biosynthesis
VREVSRQALWLLDELPSSAQLSTALDCVWGDPALRQRLSDNALLYVKERHDPEATLTACIDAIESAATDSRLKYEADCIERYAAACPNASSEEDEAFCRSIIAKRPRIGLPQILVDISALVREDLKTGIQRVVRSLLLEMLSSPPAGFIVEPVYLDDSLSYRYAHQFILSHFESTQRINDKLVAATAGDIYFGVDLHTDTTIRSAGLLVDWRRSGVRIVNVLYDLLPLQRADCFPENVHGEFGEWLKCILDCSDSILAISRTVAEDLSAMANDLGCSQTHRMPKIGWFHLGSDIEASAPSTGLTDELAKVIEDISGSTYFLMVSTLEPRKGHALVLAAFEELWDSGFEGSLVIVGRQGWMVQPLVERLRAHPQLKKRLFWLDAVSDEGLEQLYKNASALIAASEGEGFGLPIIEAARHGVPVIARDIAVFREIGGSGVSYFPSGGAHNLAQHLRDWTDMPQASRPDPGCISWLSWRQSADQALDILLDKPDARWV